MRTVVAAAIALHALGMIGGVYFVFATRSWLAQLLPKGVALTLVTAVVALIWVASGVLLLGGAWALYGNAEWYRTWLIAGAALSLVGIVLWAGKIPPGTYVGALLMLGVLGWLLFFPEAL